jgi:hypothetical protein
MFTRQETAAGAPGLTHASALVSIKELIIRRYQQNPERKKIAQGLEATMAAINQ